MPRRKKLKKDPKNIGDRLFILLLFLGLALKIYIVYFGYLYYGYIVSPGSDAISHYQYIQSIAENGLHNLSSYPPLFHLLVLELAKIFHQDVWHILTAWTPVLIVLPSLAVYFLLRQLFSLKISVLATLILLLASNYPLYAFIDGNYPDMLAYGLFSPLMFAFLIRYYRSKKLKDIVIAGLLFWGVTLTHHFTFICVLGILSIFGAVELILFLRTKKKINLSSLKIGLFALGILIILGLAYKLYGAFVFEFIKGLLTHRPGLKDAYLNSALPYSEYPQILGGIVWFGGILGFIILMLNKAENQEEAAAKRLLIIWLLFFYLFSRIPSAAVPARFARELALPLVFCLAVLFKWIFSIPDQKKNLYKVFLALGVIGYLVFMNSAFFTGLDKLPDSFSWQIWFWPKDQQKLDYLGKNIPRDQDILFNPAANLFTPIKSKSKLVPLELSDEQLKLANMDYDQLLGQIRDHYRYIHYLFIDVKPPSNPSGITFSQYSQFEIKDKILKDLGRDGKVIKKFEDGSELIQIKDY